jgi:hypothetical protein
MNLPFAPDGVKQYAKVDLVNGIEAAGRDTADVMLVVEKPSGMGWLVHFKSNSDVLSVP